ncbi:hypothetical protein B484DRAFT_400797 [Ochromonadaceae sp. CCMP2298]|nr:hypothetical protein B484DRAFT_400797 [Ochromonadaceae sp. CCMP2298]
MRVENLRLRKMEETELLRKREEEAREQTELLWMREEEARGHSERLRKKEEEAREQTERLRKRKEMRDRVLPAEQLQAYINLGEWGDELKSNEILRCAEHYSKSVSTGLEYRLKVLAALSFVGCVVAWQLRRRKGTVSELRKGVQISAGMEFALQRARDFLGASCDPPL